MVVANGVHETPAVGERGACGAREQGRIDCDTQSRDATAGQWRYAIWLHLIALRQGSRRPKGVYGDAAADQQSPLDCALGVIRKLGE